MELRCQNCHAHLSVPSVGPLKEVQCPKCGVTMLVPPRRPAPSTAEEALVEKKHNHAMRRVFDPIPRSVLYTAGVVLGLAIFSPFWAYLVFERFEKKPVFLADDAPPVAVPTNAAPIAGVPMLSTNQLAGPDLAEYAGLRLESRREELDHRFSLSLQNMRGMQPEIYVAHPANEIDQFTAHFYDGILKEFTLIMRERLIAQADAERQLIEQFGPPTEQSTGGEVAQPGLAGLGLGNDAVTKKLAGIPYRRTWAWANAHYRVDATLYCTSGESSPALAVLQIRVAAAAWLKTRRPMVGSTAPVPVPTNPPERILNPVIPLEHKLAP